MKTKIKDKDRILNCIPSYKVEKDWTFETASNSGLLTAPSGIKSKEDLREKWWLINDQHQTGSCVGWAMADSVMRWHFVKLNNLKDDELLSIRFIWMAAKETDEFNNRPTTFIERSGTSLKAALDVARKYGCVLENDLPFEPSILFKETPDIFYSNASFFKIRSYYNLNIGNKIQNWKRWLSNNGPILTRLSVDDTWYDATNHKGKLDKYISPGYGGHAVAIIGYDKNQFIIRNSWGDDWGDKGFAYASYKYAEMAFDESYGIII